MSVGSRVSAGAFMPARLRRRPKLNRLGSFDFGLVTIAKHQEIPVKVTAWVDEGIAPLVIALNEFPGVLTIDSCQDVLRGSERRGGVVHFAYMGDGRETTAFAEALGVALSACSAEYRLTAEWRWSSEQPSLELACPADGVDALAQALNACRRKASPDGILCRAPGSSTGCQTLLRDVPWRDEIEQSAASA